VDKIVGPGNRSVAQRFTVAGATVAIDLPAGPSEVVVIADGTADAAVCAADLLAQAEHGPDSEAILYTDDPDLSAAVVTLVDGYDNISIELVESLADALVRSETYAPEHLELLVADPETLAGKVRNAGAVFLGTTAVLGDYAAGSNHVLPTGGLARGVGGLGLEAFLRPVQFVRATTDGIAAVRETVETLAELEGLPLHARSVAVRS